MASSSTCSTASTAWTSCSASRPPHITPCPCSLSAVELGEKLDGLHGTAELVGVATAWAHSTRVVPQRLLSRLLQRLEEKLSVCSNEDLTQLARASVQLQHAPRSQWVACLREEVSSSFLRRTWHPTSLALLLPATVRLPMAPLPLHVWQAAFSVGASNKTALQQSSVPALATALPVEHLVDFVWALAAAGVQPPPHWTAEMMQTIKLRLSNATEEWPAASAGLAQASPKEGSLRRAIPM